MSDAGNVEHQEMRALPPVYDDTRRPLFDSYWYAATNADVRLAAGDPYEHYRLFGRYEGRAPSLFSPFDPDLLPAPPSDADEAWYGQQKRIIERSTLFDRAWYAASYSLAPDGSLDHFVREGAYVGCDPNGFFSTIAYLRAFHDVLSSGANPLTHYITDGYREIESGERRAVVAGRFHLTKTAWQTGLLDFGRVDAVDDEPAP